MKLWINLYPWGVGGCVGFAYHKLDDAQQAVGGTAEVFCVDMERAVSLSYEDWQRLEDEALRQGTTPEAVLSDAMDTMFLVWQDEREEDDNGPEEKV